MQLGTENPEEKKSDFWIFLLLYFGADNLEEKIQILEFSRLGILELKISRKKVRF